MSDHGEFSVLDDASAVASSTSEANFPGRLLAGSAVRAERFCGSSGRAVALRRTRNGRPAHGLVRRGVRGVRGWLCTARPGPPPVAGGHAWGLTLANLDRLLLLITASKGRLLAAVGELILDPIVFGVIPAGPPVPGQPGGLVHPRPVGVAVDSASSRVRPEMVGFSALPAVTRLGTLPFSGSAPPARFRASDGPRRRWRRGQGSTTRGHRQSRRSP